MKKVAFHTLGCKLNFAETSGISRQLSGKDYLLVDFHEVADIYVVHSCTVTANAERKTIAAIKQSHKRNPLAQIAVIGCMSELNPEMLRELPGVEWIVGNQDKYGLSKILEGSNTSQPATTEKTFVPSWSVNERTRSFLKIQDGCDYFCAYCTIPLARGRSRSATIDEVMKIAREIAASGLKEIVLTGINIGDFGRHQKETLYGLLMEMCNIETLERIRISSIEPDLLEERIVALAIGQGKLMPHFHIPLQAGTDEILTLMKRKYRTALFAEKVSMIRALLPDACIATDIITGYPGETEELFEKGQHFISELDLSYMHVFTYSERKNTLALKSGEKIQHSVRKDRTRKMLELSDQKKKLFYDANAGKTARVFFESDCKNGYLYGFTENYIRARIPWSAEAINLILPVRLIRPNNEDSFDAALINPNT